ncbi:hypothetical protein Pint_12671 [Pistacia integerrima]|uniref:Uncharacterized protein n=1 Tax=Pistacia integerrima TaxID=434235 RepID=A0ACC0YC04_9ROSI|nr:hypothetical protein Pint_12671 [Pistacia integerrima]
MNPNQEDNLLASVVEDIVLLAETQMSYWLKRLGIEPVFCDGLRVMDANTIGDRVHGVDWQGEEELGITHEQGWWDRYWVFRQGRAIIHGSTPVQSRSIWVARVDPTVIKPLVKRVEADELGQSYNINAAMATRINIRPGMTWTPVLVKPLLNLFLVHCHWLSHATPEASLAHCSHDLSFSILKHFHNLSEGWTNFRVGVPAAGHDVTKHREAVIWNNWPYAFIHHSKCCLYCSHVLEGKQTRNELPKDNPKAIDIHFLCIGPMLDHLSEIIDKGTQKNQQKHITVDINNIFYENVMSTIPVEMRFIQELTPKECTYSQHQYNRLKINVCSQEDQ